MSMGEYNNVCYMWCEDICFILFVDFYNMEIKKECVIYNQEANINLLSKKKNEVS